MRQKRHAKMKICRITHNVEQPSPNPHPHTLLKTIGWDIGLLFTRQIWRHSLRTLTHVRRYLGTLKITCQAVGYRKGGQRSSRFAVFRQY